MGSASLLAGLLLALAGCVALYLASPHQRWRARALPGRAARCSALVLLVAALAALCQSLFAATAVFVLLTWVMLLLALFPYLGAYLALSAIKQSKD
jgi:hypothetical protein